MSKGNKLQTALYVKLADCGLLEHTGANGIPTGMRNGNTTISSNQLRLLDATLEQKLESFQQETESELKDRFTDKPEELTKYLTGLWEIVNYKKPENSGSIEESMYPSYHPTDKE